jgi:hypothetical protein
LRHIIGWSDVKNPGVMIEWAIQASLAYASELAQERVLRLPA